VTEDELGPPFAAENLCVTARGFSTEEDALDYDYAQALASLNRGYEIKHVLTPSDGHAVGIAMTPSVIRDGRLMSHIVVCMTSNFTQGYSYS
jgi:hypothetical protein